jgi:fructose-specific phosphotransferase system IIC component
MPFPAVRFNVYFCYYRLFFGDKSAAMKSVGLCAFARNVIIHAILVLSVLLTLRAWVDARLSNRVSTGLRPQPSQRTNLAEHVVVVLFDDTGLASAKLHLPKLIGKASDQGWFTPVVLDHYTFTIAGVYTLGTGDQPSLLQIKNDFGARALPINHLFDNVRLAGGRTEVIGESLWADMYASGIDRSFTARDLGPYVKSDSDEMLRHLERSLERKDNRLTVVHLGETGHVNHLSGIHGKAISELLGELDEKVYALSERYRENTTWLIGGDHGTTVDGQHGGTSQAERTTFLMAFGPGIPYRKVAPLSQVDVANVLAVLTGAPLPTESCGLIPNVFSDEVQGQVRLAENELLRQKQALYEGLRARYGDDNSIDTQSVSQLKAGILRIKDQANQPVKLTAVVLSLLSLITSWLLCLKRPFRLLHAAVFGGAAVAALLNHVVGFWCATGAVVAVAVYDVYTLRFRWSARYTVAILIGLVVAAFFFAYPSLVYMGTSATERYVWLGSFIVLSALIFAGSGIYGHGASRSVRNLLSFLSWNLGAVFVVAVEGRYYQSIIPGGLILLTLSQVWSSTAPKTYPWLNSAKALFGVLLVLSVSWAQLGRVVKEPLASIRNWFQTTTSSSELVLGVVLVAFFAFYDRYYRGRLSRAVRIAAFGLIYFCHAAFQLHLVGTNAGLILVSAITLFVTAFLLSKEPQEARAYWVLPLIVVFCSAQQSAGSLALGLAGAVQFRYIAKKNPFKRNDPRRSWYLAFLLICYAVLFISIKGHLPSASNIEILKGFVGYHMPLILWLNVTLVCFYYLQPLWLAWSVYSSTVTDRVSFELVGRRASGLLLLSVWFTCVLLSFSTVPGDTYIKSLATGLFLLDVSLGCILAVAFTKPTST